MRDNFCEHKKFLESHRASRLVIKSNTKFGISFLRIFPIFFPMRQVTKFMKILTTKFEIRFRIRWKIIHYQKKKINQSRALTWLIQASLKTSRFSCATLLLGLEAKILAALMTCEQKNWGLGQDWKSIWCHGRFPRIDQNYEQGGRSMMLFSGAKFNGISILRIMQTKNSIIDCSNNIFKKLTDTSNWEP